MGMLDFLKTATTTHHIPRRGWVIMGTLLTLIIVPVTILGFVCRDPSSCPNETFGHWDEEYWGERRCSDAFCERCSLDSTFSSSANSFSNFGFIVIGVIVVV
jgi:hypothetical protein